MPKKKNKKQEPKTVRQDPFSVARPGRAKPNSITSDPKYVEPSRQTNYSDPSDFYANHFHNFIQFTSVIDPSMTVKFKAFLTQFEDQYSSEWNSEQVYGRNDPIQTFKNTTRKISLAWDAPAASSQEASFNMIRASQLIKMLYPSYTDTDSVGTINQAPLVQVRFRNFIGSSDLENGLFCTIDGITFAPDLEAGFFDAAEHAGSFEEIVQDELMPKLLKFSCTLTILHSQTVGFQDAVWPSKLAQFPNLAESQAPYIGADEETISEFLTGIDNNFLDGQEEFNFDEQQDLDEAIAKQGALEKSEEAKKAQKKQQREDKRAQRKDKKTKRQEEASNKNVLS
jgi:hypothetical protein